jgi:2-oxoglutarate dehydrogenase E2 component (dihydrolipoamide succinyltransferase)
VNVDVTMPQLGETVAEGTITRWLRQIGDLVTDQEPLLEITTDKVDTEVPAPASGRLLEIVVPEDSTVAVGTVLAVIGSDDDAVPAPEPAAAAPAAAAPAAPAAPAAVPEPNGARPDRLAQRRERPERTRRQVHSPLVRRLASESGIALVSLRGTGPGGRVTRSDVAAIAAAQAHAAPPDAGDQVEPMSRLRTVIAERMLTSLRTTAQLTSVVEVDVSAVVALRGQASAELSARLGVRLTYTAFYARAVVEALRAFPLLNASIGADGHSVVHHASQHLGVAVDTDRGLMVPVVKDAGDLNLLGLSRRIGELAAGARDGSLSPDDLAGGTFTLTNTGSRGVLFDTPILVPGQVGILGTGAIVERPTVTRHSDGQRVVVIRAMTHLALTYDHRLVDGADAARFLAFVKERLEAGQFRAELG